MQGKFFFLLLITFIISLVDLGDWGLAESSEARYAEISKEMFINGEYIHPTLLDIYHYHKPPLTYQITTLGYSIFGINEFGARFFLQLSLVIQIL